LRRRICEKGPCKEPEPKPVPPEPPRKICKDGPCQPCPPGQSPGKDGSCAAPPSAKEIVPPACPAGQLWNGAQCAVVGAQQCLPGQIATGGSCRTDCATSTASAQTNISELRSARHRKNDACRQDPGGTDCREAEGHYNLLFVEYQTFLAGIPIECRIELPDPNAI
jgi:hypothetical protein